MSVTWTNELELQFLEYYQAEPILWDPNQKDHKNKLKTHDAWMRISVIMEISVADLKKKRDSLLSSYRSYKTKVKRSLSSGAGVDDVHKPVWFAYEVMDSFLGDTTKCNKTINTEGEPANVDEVGNASREGDGGVKKKPSPIYAIDELLGEHGHIVVRLPPYHCYLNPIELIWAQVKQKIASQNVGARDVKDVAEDAFNSITPEIWKNCCQHVAKIEQEYYERGRILYQDIDNLVIRLGDDSSSDTSCTDEDDESFLGVEYLKSDDDSDDDNN